MNNNEVLKKCDTCKIIKPKKLFHICKYCKRCHIKDYIKNQLLNARIANHFNLSIDELNNIMTSNMNNSSRNEIVERERYDEIMVYYIRTQSYVITDNIINNFLDKIL
jgi:hypothetical protein